MSVDPVEVVKEEIRCSYSEISEYAIKHGLSRIFYETHSSSSTGAGGYPVVSILAALIKDNERLHLLINQLLEPVR
jgi:hypothetical protein